MPKIRYVEKRFNPKSQLIIQRADKILTEYMQKGYAITLRSLYYQFVAHDLFPDHFVRNGDGKWVKDPNGTINADPNYAMLKGLMTNARLTGLIDWHALEDRMRDVVISSHWTKPSEIIKSTVSNYRIDKWKEQPHYVEVWIEKDALAGVIGPACKELDVPFFASRGYASQTSAWDASQRLLERIGVGKEVHIIHLADHDPSGIDMSRDVKARLEIFTGGRVHVRRVALNMQQVQHFNPPPNPAKESDARYPVYREKFGELCWEIDALAPEVLVDIVNRAVLEFRDQKLWDEAVALEEKGKKTLEIISENFPDVTQFLTAKLKAERNK